MPPVEFDWRETSPGHRQARDGAATGANCHAAILAGVSCAGDVLRPGVWIWRIPKIPKGE